MSGRGSQIVWSLVLVIWSLFVSCFLYLGIFKFQLHWYRKMPAPLGESGSGQDRLQHFAVDVREPEVPALVEIR